MRSRAACYRYRLERSHRILFRRFLRRRRRRLHHPLRHHRRFSHPLASTSFRFLHRISPSLAAAATSVLPSRQPASRSQKTSSPTSPPSSSSHRRYSSRAVSATTTPTTLITTRSRRARLPPRTSDAIETCPCFASPSPAWPSSKSSRIVFAHFLLSLHHHHQQHQHLPSRRCCYHQSSSSCASSPRLR